MRLTTRTNLAARVLMFCGVNGHDTVRSADIAAATKSSGNHLSQVIHQLQQLGYVKTRRGRGGGLSLARAPGEISMGQVFRDFEGDVPFAECFDPDTNTCPLVSDCRLEAYMRRAIEAFYAELDQVSLGDLIDGNCGLQTLLEMGPAIPVACPPDRPNGHAARL